MPAPVLFLEYESGHRQDISHDDARQTAKQLVSTLRQARKINAKLALNSEASLRHCKVSPNWTLNAALGGAAYREEWEFIKILADRSPLSSGLEEWLHLADTREAKTQSGVQSLALAWASLLETGTVSFFAQSDWKQAWLEAQCLSLDDDGEMHASIERIRNASEAVHVNEHETWLRTLGYEQLPSANGLWNEREHRFPGLRFLPRVSNDLAKLATSGAPYKQALDTLNVLSNDALGWKCAQISAPNFSIKVTPEHEQRREFCMVHDDCTGNVQCFDIHARFTGGIPGRVHFRVDGAERVFVVAYIGFKLNGPI
jgi:hypothetical protein